MAKSVYPTAIRAPLRAPNTEIDWTDGHRSTYSNAHLRGYCPCATCQGHGGSIEFHAGGSSVVRKIEAVGGYGISIEWDDGHSTGIYSFSYLRQLCQCALCAGAAGDPDEKRSFAR